MRRFVRSIKRHLGQPYAVLLPDGRKISAVEVAAEIIRKLKRDAERHFGEPAKRTGGYNASRDVRPNATEGHRAGSETGRLYAG
jgi:hypothetical protein